MYVRRYSKLEPVAYKEAVDKLYKRDDIPMSYRKFIANKTTGLIEKKSNKKYMTRIFNSYAEAQHYQIKYGGGQIVIIGDDDKTHYSDSPYKLGRAYLLAFKKERELTEGFRYIKEMIYNLMNVKMYEMYKKCLKHKIKIVGIRTDALVTKNTLLYLNKTKGFKFSKELGGVKFETDDTCVDKRMIQEENELCKLPKFNEVQTHKIKDEYDQKEINNVFNAHNRVIVKGMLPGVGKTTAVKKYVENGRNILFVTPFNKLASEIRKDGYDVTTVNLLLGVFGCSDVSEYVKIKQFVWMRSICCLQPSSKS
jgi:hypothetical protein